MRPTHYLVTLTATMIVVAVAWGTFSWTQLGHHTPSSYSQCSHLENKLTLGRAVPSPKILIVGGSSATMGISADILAQGLGVKAFNFGLLGYYSPGLQLFEARKLLKPGDAVILAHEFLGYSYSTPSNNMIDTIYGCGTDYVASLPLAQRAGYAFFITPWRYWQSRNLDRSRINLDAETITRITALGDADVTRLPPRSLTDLQTISNFEALPILLQDESAGVTGIVDFLAWAKNNGVSAFPTWPNTIDFPAYHTDPNVEAIERFFARQGTPMVGALRDSLFRSTLFYDSNYHLTSEGIQQRTRLLLSNLKEDARFQEWLRHAGMR